MRILANKEEITKDYFKWSSPTAWILVVSFFISLITLIIYLMEINFSDEVLLFMLAILRYSSFMVVVCSFYKILLNLYRIFRRIRDVRPFKIIIYLIFLIYGILIVLLEAFIAVIARGNI